VALKASDASEPGEHGNFTFRRIIDLNDPRINPEVREIGKMDSDMLLGGSERPLEASSQSQQYNLSSNQNTAPVTLLPKSEECNFVLLSQISEEEETEIIQRGFQLQAEGKISLKKYYESTHYFS